MIPLVAPHYTREDRIWMTEFAEAEAYNEDAGEVTRFEEEFAAYVGCAGGVAVNSGTSALMVAMMAAELTTYATVPTYTCRAVYDAATMVCGTVRLVDNECDVERARFGADASVASHMFGTDNAKAVIEDITLSLGAVSPGIGVCSFHRDKMISTGRGGMIVAQDEAFLERCRELAYYDQPRNGSYSPAFSFGMTGMQAALGRSQLRQLPGFIERRREIASRYTPSFQAAGIETPDPEVASVFFRYIVAVEDPALKVLELARRGIEAGRGVNPPLHRLLGLPSEQFPGAEECFAKLLSVPVHPGLSDEQVSYITEQVLATCAP